MTAEWYKCDVCGGYHSKSAICPDKLVVCAYCGAHFEFGTKHECPPLIKMDHFPNGLKREHIEPRYDLIPPECLRRLALIYAEGVPKYGETAWLKGLPWSVVHNHLTEHYMKWLEGDRTEDHLAKVVWGIFALMYYEHHMPDVSDLVWSSSDSGKQRG